MVGFRNKRAYASKVTTTPIPSSPYSVDGEMVAFDLPKTFPLPVTEIAKAHPISWLVTKTSGTHRQSGAKHSDLAIMKCLLAKGCKRATLTLFGPRLSVRSLWGKPEFSSPSVFSIIATVPFASSTKVPGERALLPSKYAQASLIQKDLG
jgi:hypothetical protein